MVLKFTADGEQGLVDLVEDPGQERFDVMSIGDEVGLRSVVDRATVLQQQIGDLNRGLNERFNLNVNPELEELYGSIYELLKHEELGDVAANLLNLLGAAVEGSPFFNLKSDRMFDLSSDRGVFPAENRDQFLEMYRNAITKYWGDTLDQMCDQMIKVIESVVDSFSVENKEVISDALATVQKIRGAFEDKLRIVREASLVAVGIDLITTEIEKSYRDALRLASQNRSLETRVARLGGELDEVREAKEKAEARGRAKEFKLYLSRTLNDVVYAPHPSSLLAVLDQHKGGAVADVMKAMQSQLVSALGTMGLGAVVEMIPESQLGMFLIELEKCGIEVTEEIILRFFPSVKGLQSSEMQNNFAQMIMRFLGKRTDDLQRRVTPRMELAAAKSKQKTPAASYRDYPALGSGPKFVGRPSLEVQLPMEDEQPTAEVPVYSGDNPTDKVGVFVSDNSPTDKQPVFSSPDLVPTIELDRNNERPDSRMAELFDLSDVNILKRHNLTGIYIHPVRVAGVAPQAHDVPLYREVFDQPAGDPVFDVVVEQRCRKDMFVVIPIDLDELGESAVQVAASLRFVAALRDNQVDRPKVGELLFVESLGVVMCFPGKGYSGGLNEFIDYVNAQMMGDKFDFVKGEVIGVDAAAVNVKIDGPQELLIQLYDQFGEKEVQMIDVGNIITPANGSPAFQKVVEASRDDHPELPADSHELKARQLQVGLDLEDEEEG